MDQSSPEFENQKSPPVSPECSVVWSPSEQLTETEEEDLADQATMEYNMVLATNGQTTEAEGGRGEDLSQGTVEETKPSTSSQQTDLEEVGQGNGASSGGPTSPMPAMLEEEQSQQEMNEGVPPDPVSPSTDGISEDGRKAEVKPNNTETECSMDVTYEDEGKPVVDSTLPEYSTDVVAVNDKRVEVKIEDSLAECSTSSDAEKSSSSKDKDEEIDDMAGDLLTCNICLSEINNPKSLPCLHTFCLVCLQSWAKAGPHVLTCPTCQEQCPVPPDGIESLKGNFFVSKLKDRKNLKRKLSSPEKIPCSACDSGVEAIARCMECDDFLCTRCVDVHGTLRVLKAHRVIKIADVRSGKINIFKIPKLQQEQCKKHTGQILWFYCETCSTLICRDCTVVDHCRPEHTYSNLEDAIHVQRQNITCLADDCSKILNQVESEVARLKNYEQQLEKAVTEASDAVNHAADRALADLQGCVEAKRNVLQAHIKLTNEQRSSSIKEQKEKLQSLSTRLKTALDMGVQVTANGSEFEVASTFPSLTKTLRQLKTASLPGVGSELSKISFEINEGPLFTIHELGQIRKYTKWQRKCKFGRGCDGSKLITKAWAVAVTKDGSIAVANNSSTGLVSVHRQQAPYQTDFTLDTAQGLGDNPSGWKSFPRGVAVGCNGHFFITDNTMFVKEYNQQGVYQTQFAAVTPNGELSHNMRITLDSVAVDSNGTLLVGPNQHKFISVHDLTGKHIRSFPVAIEPHFIATYSGKELVLSSHLSNTVHVIDDQGNTLHVLTPENLAVWRPRGICCSKEGEVFVSNALKERGGEGSGIYRFTLTGRFLGCVTKDVTVPYGLALTDDDQTLIVGDKKMIAMFELQ